MDCLLVNPYQGVDLGTNPSPRHLVRNLYGQPLRAGIFVDKCYDVGRIENVHFGGAFWNWDEKSGIQAWMAQNAEAFVFARTDGQSVLNAYRYGYKVAYRFIASADGAANGSFLGLGADASSVAVLVEASQPGGILITNGQFVSFVGDKPTQVVTFDTFAGNLQFQNCAFWGAAHQVCGSAGPGPSRSPTATSPTGPTAWPRSTSPAGTCSSTARRSRSPSRRRICTTSAQSAIFTANRLAGPLSIANPAGASCRPD